MAGQSADPQRQGNQDDALRAAVASIRRTPDRHDSTRMSLPDALLDGCRSGNEAPRFSTLLQRSSNAWGAEGTYAGTRRGYQWRTGESLRVPMAAALSWTVSN